MEKLSDLKTGEKGVIVKVQGHGGFRKRIVEMGFIRGKTVEVILNAPLKDPIEYNILGYNVSLRRSEAQQIEVISTEEAAHLAREHDSAAQMRSARCIGCTVADCKYKAYNQSFTDSEEDELARGAREKSKEVSIALVGNPNCGKTSLFNISSGGHEKVGNYSGVTVDAKQGSFYFKGYHITLTDLPGTYSISAYSPEEKYVRNHIINQKPDVIINVIDATNLERNLFLTTQLIDMNLRMVIAFNMFDELEEHGDHVDYRELEKLLGVPIVPTVSTEKRGISELFNTAIQVYEEGDFVRSTDASGKYPLEKSGEKNDPSTKGRFIQTNKPTDAYGIAAVLKHIHVNHGPVLERSFDRIKAEIYKNPNAMDEFTPRFLAIRILQKDKQIEQFVAKFPNHADIFRVRDEEILKVEKELHDTPENAVMDAKYGFIDGALKETLTLAKPKKTLSRTARIDNIVTSKYWGYPIFIALIFIMFQTTFTLGQYPMDWIDSGVNWLGAQIFALMPDNWFRALLIGGIIKGVGGVIVFLPNILILFFFISLLESTGYMARAAFIMDKIMHKIGLHGRSFIPLIMGFGCNVPAVLATRTIENRNSRMITILINPLMSCSARLPIYLLLAGTFFPHSAGLVIFCIYFGGIFLAAIMAKIFKKFLFSKDETPFVMELPPYRIPTFKSLMRDTWDKGKQYLHKIGTIILAGSIIIWALSYFPTEQNSFLMMLGQFIEPVMKPLGFNWKVSVALLSGVAAKEIVVSTLGVLNAVIDLTPAIALSLMLFTLIYFPCVATIGAIKNETGSWKWAAFTVCYTLVLAWIVAFVVYRAFLMFAA
ncbi:MAG: ferrous iron transport protein B [Bacteroidales bacterium]|jgi:ferrous iron transport protein B|nr:ferrous iron transport protein B [Bacteroidales bacterium]